MFLDLIKVQNTIAHSILVVVGEWNAIVGSYQGVVNGVGCLISME